MLRAACTAVLSALAVLTMGGASRVHAETTACDATIASAPYTIGKPGIYCVVAPLSYGWWNPITIESSDVVLDFNGYSLSYTGNSATSRGVGSEAGVSNVTIKNGTIRGFNYGILLWASDSLVEDMRLEENMSVGVSMLGTGNIVRHNHVINPGRGTDGSAKGIHLTGAGNRVLDNDIIETDHETPGVAGSGTHSLIGIVIDSNGLPDPSNDVVVVEGNRISTYDLNTKGDKGIVTWGNGTDNLIVNNRLQRLEYGIYIYNNGTAKYRDNLTIGVAIPFTGGMDAGNNN